jgi:hypothetical protein
VAPKAPYQFNIGLLISYTVAFLRLPEVDHTKLFLCP